MKKILLPTDFSQNSEDALQYCLQFLGNSSAEIKLYHVVEPVATVDATPEISSIIMHEKIKESKSNLDVLVEKTKNYLLDSGIKNISITSDLSMGTAGRKIIDASTEFESDMIIMGIRGKNYPVLEKFFGTVSTAVIKSACPTILVPNGYRFKKIDNIIFPTKLDHKDPYELNKAMDLLKPNSAVVQCLHLAKNEEEKTSENVKEFAKYIIDHSPSVQTTFYTEVGQNIISIIKDYASSYDAEMIVMPRNQKNIFERMISKNHIKEMLWVTERPLMIIN